MNYNERKAQKLRITRILRKKVRVQMSRLWTRDMMWRLLTLRLSNLFPSLLVALLLSIVAVVVVEHGGGG
jgi:hypothetical protein